ncbi:MAG: hypothetical protein ABS49_11560 [Erythrobacter sp. SCN 62-14]|nr:MAG: hypothetical protein ABS49_11560 [Erythrobacter sp. SCN 62-14]
MKNPAIAIECATCAVPVNPVLHPKPDTVISCPQCGAAEPYSAVWQACMTDFPQRLAGKPSDASWRFRTGPTPVTKMPDAD